MFCICALTRVHAHTPPGLALSQPRGAAEPQPWPRAAFPTPTPGPRGACSAHRLPASDETIPRPMYFSSYFSKPQGNGRALRLHSAFISPSYWQFPVPHTKQCSPGSSQRWRNGVWCRHRAPPHGQQALVACQEQDRDQPPNPTESRALSTVC